VADKIGSKWVAINNSNNFGSNHHLNPVNKWVEALSQTLKPSNASSSTKVSTHRQVKLEIYAPTKK